MRMRSFGRAVAVAASVTTVLGGTTLAAAGQTGPSGHSRIQHVLLISVDGLHQQDLAWYVKNNPHSALAALERQGLEYGAMIARIQADGLAGSTAIIVSAKHGQSPTDPADLARVPDSPIIAGIDAAWKAAHPGAGTLVAFSTDDDVMQLWLSDRSQAAADFVKNYLLTHPAAGNNVGGSAITVQASGLKAVYAGAAAAAFIGVPVTDPRHPDVLGIVQHGVVYTGGKSKIAEHGGDDRQDRNVPILVAAPGLLPGLQGGRVIANPVETTQIAPTILRLLGLDPHQLQAVQIEHTRVLPGLGG